MSGDRVNTTLPEGCEGDFPALCQPSGRLNRRYLKSIVPNFCAEGALAILLALLKLIDILLLHPQRRHAIQRPLGIGHPRVDLAERPAAILADELRAKALRQAAPEQGAIPRRRDHRPCAWFAQHCGALGEGARQLEMRDILAVEHNQRGEIVIRRRSQRALAVQGQHALAPLLATSDALLALAVEIVDLFLGHALELRAGIFRTAWLHVQDLLRRRPAAGPALNHRTYAVEGFGEAGCSLGASPRSSWRA